MKPLPPVIMNLFKIPEIILGSYIFYIPEISDEGNIACSLFRYTDNNRSGRLGFDALVISNTSTSYQKD